jgi:hypothetical protein
MRRFLIAVMTCVLFVPLATLSGCGDDAKTGDIVVSPEAKQADQTGQDAMKDFMSTKSKGKSVAPSAPKKSATPAP